MLGESWLELGQASVRAQGAWWPFSVPSTCPGVMFFQGHPAVGCKVKEQSAAVIQGPGLTQKVLHGIEVRTWATE